MAVRDILLLGDPRLYERSTPVEQAEVQDLGDTIADLHDTMLAFQRRHGWGRAIAAPQIGIARRIVAMNAGEPITMLNPTLDEHSEHSFEYWEDCMSFPDLLVRLRTPASCRLVYRDLDWVEREVRLEGDYAALLQHEVDHLDGVLAVQRAVDDRAIALRATRPPKDLALRGAFAIVTRRARP